MFQRQLKTFRETMADVGSDDPQYLPVCMYCLYLVMVIQGDHKPRNPGVLRDFYKYGKVREFCATSGKIFLRKVSVGSNICVTQQGLWLQMSSLVNFCDGHSALVTCYIAGVDVE